MSMNRRGRAQLIGRAVLALILTGVPFSALAEEAVSPDVVPDNPAAAEAREDKTDYEFGGQILTLTEPEPETAPVSNDPRYQDNKNGTVTDLKTSLVWVQIDSYESRKEWINWYNAQDYIKELNDGQFGGATNWRLPTREELATLFEENKSVPWNYYWTKNELHIDPIFGKSHCCYWTREELKGDMAWGFNFIRGKPYPSMKGGIQKSLTAVRAVRDGENGQTAQQ